LWANEKLINDGNVDHFQLPSDIKPGMYILRTEIVALHSNQPPSPLRSAPQFFTYCFNVDIKGDGTATPEGVTFPGGYKNSDPGVKFNLYKPGESNWGSYVSPLKKEKPWSTKKMQC
jgi:lytic cellulose monooxygenase (C1-hydroxylating)